MVSLNKDSPEFADTGKLLSEFVRQSTVCHGCRRCFNYCGVFPSLFKLTDSKGPDKLNLTDLANVSELCFDCNLCHVNCPYVSPHEFNMDYPRIMEWGLLSTKSRTGVPFLVKASSNMDALPRLRVLGPLSKPALEIGKKLIGISPESPFPNLSREGFLANARVAKVEDPVAKVALFHTCLVENFYPELGQDLIDVYTALKIQVELKPFRCCGSPMLGVGDAERLKKNAEHNSAILRQCLSEGYDVVTPVPTCTLMTWKEYPLILGAEPMKVYDAMEYLLKLRREGKIELKGEMRKKVLYHAPCHLRYLSVGQPGVQLMRGVKAEVEQADRGCSGMDGGWGFRHYDVAKQVGSNMMAAFKESSAEVFATECPFAGLQIEKASGRKPMHPIQVLKEALKVDRA